MGTRDHDEVAERMEQALTKGYGVPYLTRNKHGHLPKGTKCRVKRTPASGIKVRVRVKDVDKRVARNYIQFTLYQVDVLKLDFSGPWYLEGYEDYDPLIGPDRAF